MQEKSKLATIVCLIGIFLVLLTAVTAQAYSPCERKFGQKSCTGFVGEFEAGELSARDKNDLRWSDRIWQSRN